MVKIKNILTKNSKLFGILFIGLSSLSLLLTIMFNFSIISLFGIILELITIGVIAIIIDKKLPTENKQIIKSKIPLFLILIIYASISRVLRGNFLFLFYLVHSLIISYCFIEGYKLFNFVPTSKLFMEDLSLLFSKNNSQNINNNVNNQNNQNVYQGQNNYNQSNIQQNMYNNMYQNQPQNQMMNNNINGYQNVGYQQGYNQEYQQNIQNQDFNTVYNYQQNQQEIPQQPLYQPNTNYQGYQPNQQLNQYKQPQMPNMNQVQHHIQPQQNQLYQNVPQQSFDNQSQAYVSHGLSDEEFDEIIEDNNKLEVKPLYEKDLHPHHQQPQQNKNKNNFTLPKIN